jgi:hypothetical protein
LLLAAVAAVMVMNPAIPLTESFIVAAVAVAVGLELLQVLLFQRELLTP